MSFRRSRRSRRGRTPEPIARLPQPGPGPAWMMDVRADHVSLIMGDELLREVAAALPNVPDSAPAVS